MKRKSLIVVLIALFCLFFTGLTKVSAVEGEWTLVTDAEQLNIGDNIAIVAKDTGYAMGPASSNGNNRTAVTVTKNDNNTINMVDNIQQITLEAGESSGTFAFNVDNGYLYAPSSSSNHLKTKTDLDATGSWAISITSGVATIQAQGATTRNLMRFNPNNGSPIFSCYAATSTTGTLVLIYKEVVGGTTEPEQPDTPVEPEVIPADAAVKELFETYYNNGTYTKHTVLNVTTATMKEVKTYFHNSQEVRFRKTEYTPDGLTMTTSSDDSVYGNESVYTNGDNCVEHTGFGGDWTVSQYNSVEDWFVTLKDFAESTLTGWTTVSDSGVYSYALTRTTATSEHEMTTMAREFVAPMWLKPNANNWAYVFFTKLTVEEDGSSLVIKLYADDNSKLVDEAKESFVFSQATITYERKENVSITEAKEIANKAGSAYTGEKYKVTGKIKNVYNTTYGNMYIEDENGNELTVYGTYSADGSTRYDAMSYKPVVGDTVIVYGVLGTYNSTPQMKDAWIIDVQIHECDWLQATCTAPQTCSICNAVKGDTLPHRDDDTDHVCDDCEAINVGNHADTNGDSKCDYCDEVIQGNEPVVTVNSADLNTLTKNTTYGSYKTTSGWQTTNCAVVTGGTSNSNPVFKCIGSANDRGVVLNGKTSAKGKLVSPTLSGTLQSISFSYSNVFSESKGVDITVNVKQGGTVVATNRIDNNSVTQYTEYKVEWLLETAVSGDFTIEIVNNSPTNSTSNKDRVAIYKLTWTTVQ